MKFPDWANAKLVASGKNWQFTVTEDCYLLINAWGCNNGSQDVFINGLEVACGKESSSTWDHAYNFIPVKQGDNVVGRLSAGSYGGTFIHMIPFKK